MNRLLPHRCLRLLCYPLLCAAGLLPLSSAQAQNGEQSSSNAVTFSGSPVPAGSSVTAGSDTAVMHLGRGGEVRVCPGTTVSVTSSPNGRDMMLGMNVGALEAHYALPSSASSSSASSQTGDSVLTPDFQILLVGQGEADFAISADTRGNTCVRTMPGNAVSIVVSELMGNGAYRVKPSEQIMFHAGQIKDADAKIPVTCGCPAPVAPIATPGPEMKPLPPSKPDDVHVAVDAPFVFSANATTPPAGKPSSFGPEVRDSEALPVTMRVRVARLPDVVIPPSVVTPPAAKPGYVAPHGFLGKIRKFFGAIFR